MSVKRCHRCLGQKKATYMGGMYVTCKECNGAGYSLIDNEVINTDIIHTEIKPVLTFEATSDLLSKSQAKRIDIQSSDKIDKRSKAYKDQKLKEALE